MYLLKIIKEKLIVNVINRGGIYSVEAFFFL